VKHPVINSLLFYDPLCHVDEVPVLAGRSSFKTYVFLLKDVVAAEAVGAVRCNEGTGPEFRDEAYHLFPFVNQFIVGLPDIDSVNYQGQETYKKSGENQFGEQVEERKFCLEFHHAPLTFNCRC